MFNTVLPTGKGEVARKGIFETALRLFRERGFEETTMRDVAAQGGSALGAAYYYFPSKEAIITSYYDVVQGEHVRRVRQALGSGNLDLKGRIRAVIHSKLDIVQDDRRLLGVGFRYSGEPDHPLSCLGPVTAPLRSESIHLFREAIGDERLPKDLNELFPLALWALHMGVLVLFLYDRSPGQERTRALVDGAVDLSVRVLSLARNPLLKPFRGRLVKLLRDADLLPDPGAGSPRRDSSGLPAEPGRTENA